MQPLHRTTTNLVTAPAVSRSAPFRYTVVLWSMYVNANCSAHFVAAAAATPSPRYVYWLTCVTHVPPKRCRVMWQRLGSPASTLTCAYLHTCRSMSLCPPASVAVAHNTDVVMQKGSVEMLKNSSRGINYASPRWHEFISFLMWRTQKRKRYFGCSPCN